MLSRAGFCSVVLRSRRILLLDLDEEEGEEGDEGEGGEEEDDEDLPPQTSADDDVELEDAGEEMTLDDEAMNEEID